MERLRAACAARRFAGGRIALTFSVGVAGFPDHAVDIGSLIAEADRALYAAKSAGKNRGVIVGRHDANGRPLGKAPARWSTRRPGRRRVSVHVGLDVMTAEPRAIWFGEMIEPVERVVSARKDRGNEEFVVQTLRGRKTLIRVGRRWFAEENESKAE